MLNGNYIFLFRLFDSLSEEKRNNLQNYRNKNYEIEKHEMCYSCNKKHFKAVSNGTYLVVEKTIKDPYEAVTCSKECYEYLKLVLC